MALVGATVHVSPTEEPIRDAVVLVEKGEIAAVDSLVELKIPRDAQTLDCSGLTLCAGFWNSHVHFFERKWADADAIPASELGRQLQDMLTRYGFTSVFDLSSEWRNTRRIRERIESGEVRGPRIRSTGEGLIPAGAAPSEQVLNLMGVMKTPLPEMADAGQAAAISKRLLDEGVDGIKLFARPPGPPAPSFAEGALEAVVGAAHRRGKPVFVHPNSGADVLAALRAGVDVVAHTTPRSGAWDDAVLAAIKHGRSALTPTLALWRYYARHDRVTTQEQIVSTAGGQLRAWLAANGAVLFGTDLGVGDYDPGEEYALMAEAGMSFRQILASLTTAPAERFGESSKGGRVAAGLEADLVVFRGDPTKDIRSLADVQYTLRGGRIVYRASE